MHEGGRGIYHHRKFAKTDLRKYGTHQFYYSVVKCYFWQYDVIWWTLTKQVPDNQFIHFYMKSWKVLYRLQVFKETSFCGWGFVEETATTFAIFDIRCVFFSTPYFSSEKDQGKVKIVSDMLKSLYYQKLVKIVSSDNSRLTWYTFSSYLGITVSKLTEKIVCSWIFLKFWTLNLIFSHEKYKFNKFPWRMYDYSKS